MIELSLASLQNMFDFNAKLLGSSQERDYNSNLQAFYSQQAWHHWSAVQQGHRKISAKYWQRQNDETCEFICELINFKPYIQHSSYDESVMELVENSEVYPGLDSFCRASALQQLCAMLSWLEPQFHPLIREGHKDVLAEIVHHSFYLYNITYLQPLQPNLGDFPAHLRPCSRNYIDEKNKMYHMAKEQARLHEEFDAHVSTGALDHFICKGDALNAIVDDDIIHSRFSVLDHTLIKLSSERRAKLLGRRDQLCLYNQHLRQVVHNEQLRIGLQSLMCELEAEGFFSIADDSIDWDKKCFSQLVEKFDKQVFVGLDLPKYYVIRGIMDYQAMSLMKDDSCSWDQVFEKLWMGTRYYKHQFYDIIHQPLQQFLPTP